MNECEREALRYLGIRDPDEQMRKAVAQGMAVLQREAQFRIASEEAPCRVEPEGVQIGALEIKSADLARNLKGCDRVILMAATLGLSVDRLIQQRFLTNSAQAVILQACAAALLEAGCDRWQEGLEGPYPGTRTRFSPGYGDLSLDLQGAILSAVRAPARIGLNETSSHMLTPTKSITAVLGIAKDQQPIRHNGCRSCPKPDCAFRKEGKT